MSRLRTYVQVAGRTVAAGDARFNFRRGRLTATFSYDRDYIALPGAYAIDPPFALQRGPGHWTPFRNVSNDVGHATVTAAKAVGSGVSTGWKATTSFVGRLF